MFNQPSPSPSLPYSHTRPTHSSRPAIITNEHILIFRPRKTQIGVSRGIFTPPAPYPYSPLTLRIPHPRNSAQWCPGVGWPPRPRVYKGSDPALPKLTTPAPTIEPPWPDQLIRRRDLAPCRPFLSGPLKAPRPWDPITGLTKLRGDDTAQGLGTCWPFNLMPLIVFTLSAHLSGRSWAWSAPCPPRPARRALPAAPCPERRGRVSATLTSRVLTLIPLYRRVLNLMPICSGAQTGRQVCILI